MKLQDCEKECDKTKREAKFAIRATDLECWQSSSASNPSGKQPTDSDPKIVQHWALVAYFPIGKIIHFFEAWEENGQLQAGRAEIAFDDIKIFEKADYIGTAETSPCQLLQIAKHVKTGEFDPLFNNCQTWLTEYLKQIKINCTGSSVSLPDKYLDGLNN